MTEPKRPPTLSARLSRGTDYTLKRPCRPAARAVSPHPRVVSGPSSGLLSSEAWLRIAHRMYLSRYYHPVAVMRTCCTPSLPRGRGRESFRTSPQFEGVDKRNCNPELVTYTRCAGEDCNQRGFLTLAGRQYYPRASFGSTGSRLSPRLGADWPREITMYHSLLTG